MNDGTIRKVIGWRTGEMDWYWHDSEDCASEWHDNESAHLVCGVCRLESKFESAEAKIK